ncbi:MAG: PAS domain S-box protein [Planctomycetota bacterium]|nr:MAG: PAS domain S-box protein [Planctomycetota bacterium]
MRLQVLTGLRCGADIAVEERVVLGREAAVDLRLPDLLVSSRHAEVCAEAGGFVLRDLASTNGTFVNGERLSSPHRLRVGDVLQLGATEVLFTDRARDLGERGTSSRVQSALAPLATAEEAASVRFLSDDELPLELDAEGGPRALYAVGAVQRSFALAADLDALLERIARAFSRAVGGRGVVVALAEEGRPVVRYRGSSDDGALYRRDQVDFAVRDDLLERALSERGAFLASAGPDAAETAVSSNSDPAVALSVSLPSASGIVGAVYVHGAPADLEPDDLRLLFLVAQLAGVNVRTHLLLAALRERNAELEAAREELAGLNEELRELVDDRTAALGRADRRLRLYARVVETVPEAIVTTTLEGVVTSWNPGAEALYGYPAAEVLGELLPTLPDAGGATFDRAREEVLAGRTLTLRTTRFARDGSELPVEVTFAPVPSSSGEPAGLVEIGRDLRERLRSEERLRLRERLASFGELAAGLAHELGGPLTNLRSGVEYLLARERSPEETRSSLEVLESEIERLHRLVQQALGLARWEPPRRREVAASELVDYVVSAILPRAESQGVEVLQPPRGAARLHADEDQLKQALLNLAANAIEAMPDGGRLELSVFEEPDEVGFVVRDDGLGIAPEDRERVFRLFFSKRLGGSGIGLAVVKRIVDLHGGRVELESQLGRGTRVRLSFPKSEEERS